MPKINLPQYGFSAGALGSKMWGRADLTATYNKAAKDIVNMIPMPQGTLMRRPGTKFMRKTHSQTEASRLIPFIFDNTDTYMLEMSPGEIRVFKDRLPLLTDTHQIVNGTFATDLSGWLDFLGNTVWNADSTATLQKPEGDAGGLSQQVIATSIGTNSYAILFDFINTGFTQEVALSVGTTPFGNDILSKTYATVTADSTKFSQIPLFFSSDQPTFYITLWAVTTTATIDNVSFYSNLVIPTDYTEADIQALSYVTSGQKLYIAAPGHPPTVMIRTSDYDWYFQNLNYLDGPYFDLADPQYGGHGANKTLNVSGVSGAVTITASDILFNANDFGRHVRYRSVNTADWGWAIITNYISPTQVTALVQQNFDAAAASIEWTLGAWGLTPGFPSVVSASTGRICWANSPTQPNGFWASRSSSPNVYSPDDHFDDNITASTALAIILAEATDITSLVSGNDKIFVGTSSGIFSIINLSQGFYNVSVGRVDSTRTAPLMPLSSQGSAFFISAGLRNLYTVSYNYQQIYMGDYQSEDVTIPNDDYALLGFLEGATTYTPLPIMWFRMATGDLLSFTYGKMAKVAAWARHQLGGTNVFIESMAVQPRQGSDDLWLIVRRDINGVPTRFIEFMTDFQTAASQTEDLHYVDAGLDYSGEALTEMSGLNHLVGETVMAHLNGASYENLLVAANGIFISPTHATSAAVGLGYNSEVTLLQQEGGSQSGSVFGRAYRVSNAHIRFWNSNGVRISFEQAALQNINSSIYFNETAMFGQGTDLVNGWKSTRINSGSPTEVNMVLSSAGTLALNLQAVMLEIEPSEF